MRRDAVRPVRGMVDRLGLTHRKYEQITDAGRRAVESFGFQPITTPILEYSSIFERSLGQDSDVVGKELYKFQDSSSDWMTMRPEGTAAVVRAVIHNALTASLPQKLYYSGPMFRHERPQKGRLRQFEQFGVEVIGISHPASDVECIESAWSFLNSLPLAGDLELQINTIGDAESRMAYRQGLTAYLSDFKEDLSEDSRRRLTTNPLRILDSKDENDKKILLRAPKLATYMNDNSRDHFNYVCRGLEAMGIPYKVNDKLVRGLDYYQHTVWEVVCNSQGLGKSQATILAGGRYDGLVETMGGPKLPGIGWAAGIDRLALLVADQKVQLSPAPIPVLIIRNGTQTEGSELNKHTIDQSLYNYAMKVAQVIRQKHRSFVYHPVINPQKKVMGSIASHPPVSKQLAHVLGADHIPQKVVLVGGDEMESSSVVLRDTETKKQTKMSLDEVLSALS
ncbi:hypothetical protein EC988_003961 [Linderina pennispora]|nr:hypothetical protein EC988_003961 [Linderina pennispora]